MESNYQLTKIHNYINDLMAVDDMHTFEQEALRDPFLQDAIDGYRLQQGVDPRALSLLQQRLQRRVAEQARLKHSHYFGWQRLTVGLVAAVMFVVACTLLLIRYFPDKTRSNITEVELMDEQLSDIRVEALPNSTAQPLSGWEAYQNFLSQNYAGSNPVPEVIVAFQIDKDGSPYQITIQTESNNSTYEELKSLIAKGPKWKGASATLKITFPE